MGGKSAGGAQGRRAHEGLSGVDWSRRGFHPIRVGPAALPTTQNRSRKPPVGFQDRLQQAVIVTTFVDGLRELLRWGLDTGFITALKAALQHFRTAS